MINSKHIVFVVALITGGEVCADTLPVHNPFRKPALVQSTSRLTVNTHVAGAQALPSVRATLVGGAVPLILVGDRVYGIGDSIDGYALVAVREGVAVFKHNDELTEVSMNEPSSDTANTKESDDVD